MYRIYYIARAGNDNTLTLLLKSFSKAESLTIPLNKLEPSGFVKMYPLFFLKMRSQNVPLMTAQVRE